MRIEPTNPVIGILIAEVMVGVPVAEIAMGTFG